MVIQMEEYSKRIEVTILAKDKEQARHRFNFIIGRIQEKAKVRVISNIKIKKGSKND